MNDLYLRNLAVPFLSQRKNTYIWKSYYTKEEAGKLGKSTLAGTIKETETMSWCSCNITSVCMVLHYFGITRDTPDDILQAYYQGMHKDDILKAGEETQLSFPEKDYYTISSVQSWYILYGIIKGMYGADCQYQSNLTLVKIKESIAAGYPVVVNYGGLVDQKLREKNEAAASRGHIIVVRGFKKVGNEEYIIVNDPWGMPATFAGELPEIKTGGEIKRSIYFDNRTKISESEYAGGIGDNCVIKLDDFKKVILGGEKVCSSLIIKAPLWSYPVSDLKPFKEQDIKAVYSYDHYSDGGFPLKSNNLWHNGIHMKCNGVLKAIGPGRLIAMRNEFDNPPETGSNSFMLLEHRVKIDKQIKVFYSTYMHMKPLNIKAEVAYYISGELLYMSEQEKSSFQFCNYGWLMQIADSLLPVTAIAYFDDSTPIYKAKWNNGNVEKTSVKEDTVKKGMQVQVLPARRMDILEKLVNPAAYDDADFLQAMENTQLYTKGGFVYFMYSPRGAQRTLCCCNSSIFKHIVLTGNQQFRFYAKRVKELTEGKTVSFIESAKSLEIALPQVRQQRQTLSTMLKNIIGYFFSDNPAKTQEVDLQKNIPENLESYFEHVLCDETYSVIRLEKKRREYGAITNVQEYAKIQKEADELKKQYINERESFVDERLQALQSKNAALGIVQDHSVKEAEDFMKEYCAEAISFVYEKGWAQKSYTIKSKKASAIAYETYAWLRDSVGSLYPGLVEIVIEWLLLRLFSVPADKISKGDYYKTTDSSIRKNPEKKGEGALLYYYHIEREKTFNAYYASLHMRYIDTYIEVNSNAVLGKAGSVYNRINHEKESDVFHFEIFSAENLFARELTEIKDNDRNAFFDAKQHSKTLINAGIISQDEQQTYFKYFDDGVLLATELTEFYKESSVFKNIAVYHMSEWADGIDWTSIPKTSIPFGTSMIKKIDVETYIAEYYSRFVWMKKELFGNTGSFTQPKAWFYHPLRFMELLVQKTV